MSYKGAILDLDNVLFPTSDYERRVVSESVLVMRMAGLPTDQNQGVERLLAIRKRDPNAPDHFNQLCKYYGLDDPQAILEVGIATYHNVRDTLVVSQPETTVFLDFLVENEFRNCVVTHGRKDKQLNKLKRLEILPYFSSDQNDGRFVYVLEQTDDKVGRKQFLVKRAIVDLDLDPEISFVVDDRPYGIVAAKKAGIKYGFRLKVGKYTDEDYGDIDERFKDDREVESLSELASILKEMSLAERFPVNF